MTASQSDQPPLRQAVRGLDIPQKTITKRQHDNKDTQNDPTRQQNDMQKD